MTEPRNESKPDAQRDAVLDNERKANKDQPRNFKEEAITEKVVKVEPDGTGPSPADSLDPKAK
jgi:hypothetical protein